MGESALVSFLERQAGEYHRGTVRYDGNVTDVLHLREDVEDDRIASEIDRMLGRLRPEASQKEAQAFPFGRLNATVRLFEEAILLHFPQGKDRGVVVSLEPDTAQNLNTFIGECEKRIRS